MNIVYPIRLESPAYAKDSTGVLYRMTEISEADLKKNITFVDNSETPQKTKGYDSSQHNDGKGTKITNLTSISNGVLMKECPRCTLSKDQNEFGDAGRTTDEYRDQSWCKPCRPLASRRK
ncbi:MAG TPA: hypothetical protein VK539_23065 [Myxococcaceae bacterium]|nr:hypothetical protein [Myxococcaceae bacterium]